MPGLSRMPTRRVSQARAFPGAAPARCPHGEDLQPPRTALGRGLKIGVSLLLCLLTLGAIGCRRRAQGLERVREAGVLRIATDPSFAPFAYVDGSGVLVGLDVDLGREIAERLGVDAHFVATGYDALYDALLVGRADVIVSALYPDPSRMQDFVFSAAYFNAGEVLVVEESAPIAGQTDLAGQSVAVVFGTTGHMEALRWMDTHRPPPELVAVEGPAEAVALLTERTAVAAVVDHASARIALAHQPGLRVVLPPISDHPYVIAARVQDRDLLEAIDGILTTLVNEGVMEALITRWMR